MPTGVCLWEFLQIGELKIGLFKCQWVQTAQSHMEKSHFTSIYNQEDESSWYAPNLPSVRSENPTAYSKLKQLVTLSELNLTFLILNPEPSFSIENRKLNLGFPQSIEKF